MSHGPCIVGDEYGNITIAHNGLAQLRLHRRWFINGTRGLINWRTFRRINPSRALRVVSSARVLRDLTPPRGVGD